MHGQQNIKPSWLWWGAHGGVVVKALRYKPAGRGFDSRWCQDFSCRSHYGPGVDSTSNRNEYQVCFLSSGMLLGVKADCAYGWQPTTITVPLSRKLGALTLLDPSGPPWPVGDDFTITFVCLINSGLVGKKILTSLLVTKLSGLRPKRIKWTHKFTCKMDRIGPNGNIARVGIVWLVMHTAKDLPRADWFHQSVCCWLLSNIWATRAAWKLLRVWKMRKKTVRNTTWWITPTRKPWPLTISVRYIRVC